MAKKKKQSGVPSQLDRPDRSCKVCAAFAAGRDDGIGAVLSGIFQAVF